MNSRTKKITMIAMLVAASLVAVSLFRIPIVLFLKYEPKDVIITIGGFLFGPFTAFLVSAAVAIIEMFTMSDTGVIGAIMNLLASCTFACTASYIYKKKHTAMGAVFGLITASLLSTGVMLLWNYLITPLYMGIPREGVVELMLPALLPFNLLKVTLNSSIILLVYKPIVTALRRLQFIESTNSKKATKSEISILASILLITCLLIILVWKGII